MNDTKTGFRLWAVSEPDQPAVITADDREFSYGELFALVNKISHGLAARGLSQGDTVACVMANGVGMVALYLAAMQSGMYLVTLNYHLTPREIGYILSDSGARLVVCSERVEESVIEAVGSLSLDIIVDRDATTGEVLSGLTQDMPESDVAQPTAGSLMMYTSGTTGRPKGVKRPLSGLDADAGARTYEWLFQEFGMEREAFSAWLVAAPLYHSANITPAVGALHAGGTLVFMDGWTPEGFLARVAERGVSGTSMVPTHFYRLLQLPEDVRRDADVSSLRYVIHGAAPCPIDVKRRILEWFGPVVYEYYGSTEVGTTIARPEEWLTHPGTVGRPASISTLKILDDDGVEVAPGETGIVYMRQGADRMEYHNDAAKTDGSRRDGLFTVWDVGHVDEDGFLYITGRAAELILVGGVNVYPAEIEAALLEHPDVADVGVVGERDDEYGEIPVAHVALSQRVSDPQAAVAELAAHAAERLARPKRPVRYEVHAALPRDPNGKLYKAKLTPETDRTGAAHGLR